LNVELQASIIATRHDGMGLSAMFGNAKLADAIISWVKEVVANASSKGVVFGLSGGIDSSVVAVLCKRACPESSLGVIMPCHSNETDREHAELVAKKFQIPFAVVVLDSVFDALVKAFPVLREHDDSVARLALANIKPRLRMVTLYYFANRLGYLVGVDIMPLGNLVKSQVRDLAKYLGIPQVIIDKPPSAGLWEGQTDEVELGVTYHQLDRYLTNGQAEGEIKDKIDSMIAKSAHKRSLPLLPPFWTG
jgi:NAD+ synthase